MLHAPNGAMTDPATIAAISDSLTQMQVIADWIDCTKCPPCDPRYKAQARDFLTCVSDCETDEYLEGLRRAGHGNLLMHMLRISHKTDDLGVCHDLLWDEEYGGELLRLMVTGLSLVEGGNH